MRASIEQPVHLCGDAYARGFDQARACPEEAEAVRDAVALRLDEARDFLVTVRARRYLECQFRFTAEFEPMR